MANASHYIANSDNAHINASEFETNVRKLLADGASNEGDIQHPWSSIHDLVESNISDVPDEPADDQLICRYLSPVKFLWFVSQASVYFGSAGKQSDQQDSAIPADYNYAVQKELFNAGKDGSAWDRFCYVKQSQWLISCWTKLDSPFDDNLLWHSYAGGSLGVGVTVRYGVLRDYLRDAVARKVGEPGLFCGEVAYQDPLRLAAFNKRNIFRNDNEVRFAIRATVEQFLSIDITSIKPQLGLRLSAESPNQHRAAVEDIWRKFGGSDEIHTAGD